MATSSRRVVLIGFVLLAALIAIGIAAAAGDSDDDDRAAVALPEALAGRFGPPHHVPLTAFEPGLPAFWQVDNIPGNNELQRYRDGNVRITDGALVLRAERSGTQITSGAVNVGFGGEGLVHPGSYVEARMRFPTGTGMWGALWLMPLDDGGSSASTPEIDIVETVGGRRARTEHFVHYQGVDEGFERLIDYTDWHTYGVWIADDGVHYFVDGIEIGVNPAAPTPNSDTWGVIANLAVGGHGGEPDDESFPAQVEMSSLTVWS
jgi:beta-glucanase (GH16 family)